MDLESRNSTFDTYGVAMTTLLVASTGGHLAQIHAMRTRLAAGDSVVWATFRNAQSESLLAGETVEWLDYIPPRGAREVVRDTSVVPGLLRKHKVDRVFSTGAAIALAVFPVARMFGIPCTYIESAARTSGPSVTGRLVRRLPGVECRTQYREWANERWTYAGSVFDEYAARPTTPPSISQVLVTLGTIKPYGFARLIETMARITPSDVRVVVQHGDTKVDPGAYGSNFEFVESLPARDLHDIASASDAIVGHAGIGTALLSLSAGRRPVLAIRRSAHGEHVDDHQELIARVLGDRSLSVSREADAVTWDDIKSCAAHVVQQRSSVPQPA